MNHIDVAEVANSNGYIVQELTIDGILLGQWLDKHTECSEYERIATFIRPFSELLSAWSCDIDWKGDKRFVKTLIDMDKAPVPILLCEDDSAFSCIVIVADVEKTEDFVYWNRIGYVTHNGESLEEEMKRGIVYINSYTDNDWVFDRQEYDYAVSKYYELQKLRQSEALLDSMDGEQNCEECAKILEELLPMGEKVLQKQMDEYGEILFDPYICDVIASPLKDIVRSKEPDKILLETYLNALKILKRHGDVHVRNNLEISILDDFDEERIAFRKYGLKYDEL